MGLAIVGGEFLADFDGAQGIELDAAAADAQHRVGCAAVVGVAQRVGRRAGIDGALVRDLDHVDALQAAHALVRFFHADGLAADLADLLVGRDGLGREGAQAVDAAWVVDHRELLRIRRHAFDTGCRWRRWRDRGGFQVHTATLTEARGSASAGVVLTANTAMARRRQAAAPAVLRRLHRPAARHAALAVDALQVHGETPQPRHVA